MCREERALEFTLTQPHMTDPDTYTALKSSWNPNSIKQQ
jgi:hypothetical protein